MKTFCCVLLLIACPVWAAESGAQMELFSTFGALIFVVALILGLAWMMKKMRIPVLGRHQDFSVIRQLPIGTRERLMIVKAGEEQFLIGVTSQTIQLIAKLDSPLQETQVHAASGKDSFANQLSQLLKKNETK